MADVIKRVWRSGPRRVKRVAYGYTLQKNGKQVRKFNSAWTQDDAERELAAARLQRAASTSPAPVSITFGEAVTRYLQAKSRKKSIKDDERHLAVFKASFGADTALSDITAARISAWKTERLGATCPRTKEPYSAAAINRPLAALRHLLQLAHEEWEVLPAAPRIRMEREPEGRIRWLEPADEARLLKACRAARNPQLVNIVTVALESGLRRGELLELTWDRVDLSRGVLRLEVTKAGRRREVPMRQTVYDVLAGMPGPREGRVWSLDSIRTGFENAVEAAGLGDFTFHDCRHHFASWFVMRGGSLQALKEILGHRDIKMTLRYAHLAPDHLRQEVAKTERQAASLSTTSAQSDRNGVDSERAEKLTS